MNAHELARRQPVWLALANFYLDTELQPADLRWIRAVFDQSGYSEQEIREIDYEEVGPLLYSNLLSVAGEWAGFDEAALFKSLTERAGKKATLRSLPLVRWFWRKGIECCNQAYFQRVFAG